MEGMNIRDITSIRVSFSEMHAALARGDIDAYVRAAFAALVDGFRRGSRGGRYGDGGAAVPQALTDYIKNREGYDYNEHGRAGNSHTTFVPDEIVERFCLLGSPREHVEKLKVLQDLGVTPHLVAVSTCYVAGNRRGNACRTRTNHGPGLSPSPGYLIAGRGQCSRLLPDRRGNGSRFRNV